ncbi:alpha-2A adrenergic receptor-like [Gigantopelta aegis]|uniref:alpha-2A adrenergic receptor-like n=1 Tax=Gigantopelta aegis TaxID=1735272 RepID=UPI001B88B748|nr:alpha-2A adrenergic receptor-like [Gigantopelta aegis]
MDNTSSSFPWTSAANDNNETSVYRQLIEKLNYERMLFQLPVVVTLLVVMVMGIFGNIVVISVYKQTCKKRISCFFMNLLAVVDLTTALCIPFDIQDMLNPYMNPAPVACKIGRFLESFTAVLSGNLLICISFDRYFHIIYPLKRYSLQQAKSLAIVMTALALSLTWPQLFLAGTKTVKTSIEGVHGEDCSFRNEVRDSIYTMLFQGALALSYAIGFGVSVIFYCRIYFVIWRRRRTIIGEQVISPKKSSKKLKSFRLHTFKMSGKESKKCSEITEISYITTSEMGATDLDSTSPVVQRETSVENDRNEKITTGNNNPDRKSSCLSARSTVRLDKVKVKTSQKTKSTTRFTRIMTIVTISSILAFTPYLLVNIFHNMGMFFYHGMSKTADIVYEFSTKSFYLNSFVNPIIYSVMNPTFRRDAIHIIRKMCKMCRLKRC